ncbi:GNAT family N-acetyltransferase [Methylobacterium sp. JK268]
MAHPATAADDPVRRPERPGDGPFLRAVFAASQGRPLAGLPADLRDLLLAQCCAGQAATYRARHPAARFDVVEAAGVPVGRIVTERGADALTILDLALLPDWRGRGFGTRLLRDAMAEAAACGLPVRLTVAADNGRARRLYARLGFREVAAGDLTLDLAWDPAPVSPIPDRLRLPLRFDAEALAAECDGLGRAPWIRHFVTGNYAGDWDVIPLRAPADATHPVRMIHADPACRDFRDTPFLDACPAIRAALAALPCPLDAVRLMRLSAGSVIREHRDPDLAFEDGAVRLHVPLRTHAGVDFRLNGTRVTMAAGTCWYLRLSDPHSVRNDGPGERIHLVIDARVDPWLAALFARAREAAA